MADLRMLNKALGNNNKDSMLTFNSPRPSSSMDVFNGASNSSLLLSPRSQTAGSPCSASGSSDTRKMDKRFYKREREKTRQRRYRQRLKDSRDDLQRQVDELTNELKELRKKDRFRLADWVRAPSHWIVEERTKRTESEAEHQRLIAAVNEQAAYIQRLSLVMKKRLHGFPDDYESGGLGKVACYRSTPKPCVPPNVLYSTYLNQLDGSYAQVDAVMSSCNITVLPETTINTTHRQESVGDNMTYFQHVSKMALPYSFKQTVAALRTAIYEGNYENSKKTPLADLVMKTRVFQSSFGGILAQQFISRIYIKESRCVLVWKIISHGKGAFDGLQSEETAWLSIRPTPTDVMIEVCVRQVPMRRTTRAQYNKVATQNFHHMLRSILEKDRMDMAKRLDGLLLDDILNGIEC